MIRHARKPGPYNPPMPKPETSRQDGGAPPERLPLLPRNKKFLIPVIILLAVTVVGSVAGVLIGFRSIKSSDAFKTTTAELADHPPVQQYVGRPFDTGMLVIGKHDERNGTYDLTFTIEGPKGKAAVRSRCEREGEGLPWQVTYMDLGVGGRDGQVFTLVGSPDDMPGQ